MIEQFTSPVAVNNSQELWLVGEGVVVASDAPIPSLDFDFITGGLPGTVTFTRASTATYFNSSGVLTSAGNNVARFDYNPTTLAARGLLIEEQRTNSIRNNTMVGAVAGTPGTVPTNWAGFSTFTNVVGTGTENGITYVDIQFVGTTTGATGSIAFETITAIAAASGQTWTNSVYIRLVAGSFTNVSQIRVNMQGYTSASASNTDVLNSTDIISSLSATNIAANRRTVTGTLADATTAYIRPRLFINWTNGAAVDFTLRIGLPQLEQGAFATSVIPTTTTALTRNADVASVNTLSPWYNQSAGTLMLEAVAPTGTTTLFPVVVTNGTVEIASIRTFSNTVRFGIENVASGSAGSITAGNTYKAALGYTSGDQAMSVNSAAVITGTTVLTTTASILRVGANASGAGGFANSWLRRITYYPRRLSNAELQAITA